MKEIEVKTGTICNNNCSFCLNSDKTWQKSLDDIKQEILRAKKKGVKVINFTGGEPTIRKDFFDMLDLAKRTGLMIICHTNGRTLQYDWFAERMQLYRPIRFLISLHAHNKELYQNMANADGYEQTIKGIKNLKKNKIGFNINTVINSKNIDYLPLIAEHHSGLNPDIIQLSWIRPQGKAKDSPDLLKFSEGKEKLKEALEILKREKQEFSLIGMPYCLLPEYNQYKGDPYKESIIISKDNKEKSATDHNTETRKRLAQSCETCGSLNECGGIHSGYPAEFFEDIDKIKKQD